MKFTHIDGLADLTQAGCGTSADIDSLDFTKLLAEQRWPGPLAKEAFLGPIGDFVKLIEPNSEASEVSLLLTGLVNLGHLIGRDHFFQIESDRHCGNEFLVLVGDSALARKGTADGHVSNLFSGVDELWFKRKTSGLSKGEGLIYRVRDSDGADRGVDDKRLLVTETEFANCLKVMSRDSNTLSSVIRNAWDSKNLSILTKQEPATASNPHISIVGHITSRELEAYLGKVEIFNGFANRFLWAMVKRSKRLPFGGRVDNKELNEIRARLKDVMLFASEARELNFDAEVKERWPSIYESLTDDDGSLVTTILARSAPHVIRLALIYAISEERATIESRHLDAALAVWSYCSESVRILFGKSTGNTLADKILDYLRLHPMGRSQGQISEVLLSRNKSASEIGRALVLLQQLKKISKVPFESSGPGRPPIWWRAH